MPIGTPKREKVIFVKVSDHEYEQIKAKAEKYANGVISAWVRYAIKQEPKRKDVDGSSKNKGC